MKGKKGIKYAGLTLGCTVVCVALFLVLRVSHALGGFISPEPYVTGTPESSSVIVTLEGGNQKGSLGSEATPCSPEVPTAVGIKGSETNPFVLLEIVPDKAMQQWTYLTGNTESGMPEQLDPLKIGIAACKKIGENFRHKDYNLGNMKLDSDYGQWLANDEYEVYKIGSDKDKEKLHFMELGVLHTKSISSLDIENPDEFEKVYQNNRDNNISKLFEEYPNLFEKDDDKKDIEEIAKEDAWNWVCSDEKHVISEAKESKIQGNGYLIAVEPGKGEYGYASDSDFDNHYLTKTGTDKDRWIYYETLEQLQQDYPTAKEGIWDANFANSDMGIGWESIKGYLDGPEITGLYMSLATSGWVQYTLCDSPEVSEQLYTFKYWGLKTNEIVKRALFTFRDQEDYDNFHLKVICMTPAELNELAKKDTDSTMDMIERADMFSIQTYVSATQQVNDTEFLSKLYHKFILGEKDYEYDRDKIATFYENDLEWDLCCKIIERTSINKNLPVVFNQMVGHMVEEGVDQDPFSFETHMYITAGDEALGAQSVQTDRPYNGTLNNISKLYLISIQFDLLARKDKDSMDRTFMEDIYPYIQKIPLAEAEGAVENTATTTGYFVRPLCTCDTNDFSQEMKERSYYLWNLFTFFPTSLSVDINGIDKDLFLKNGYVDNFFGTNANPFRDAGSAAHQKGSDGTDDKNVTIVGGGVADSNHSGLLANMGGAGAIASSTFEAAYLIMNGQAEDIEGLVVNVLKQKKWYTKLSDESVMIDYNSQANYENDKTLYLKVSVTNVNNENGIIRRIRMISDSGDEPIDLTIQSTLDDTTKIEQEDVLNSKGENPIHGYKVEGKLIFYIPYSLKNWQNGYRTVRIVTQGRMYNSKKEKFVTGPEQNHDIDIAERQLFALR